MICLSNIPFTRPGRAGVLNFSGEPVPGQKMPRGSPFSLGRPDVRRDRREVEEERLGGAVVLRDHPPGQPALRDGLVDALVRVVDRAVVVQQHVEVLVGAALELAVGGPVDRAPPVGPAGRHVAEGVLPGDGRLVRAVAVHVLAEEHRVVAGLVQRRGDRRPGRRRPGSCPAGRPPARRCCGRTGR